MKLNEAYWTERYDSGQMGWDIGYPSTPIREYIDQLENKSLRILIPGAGNAYEAEYLYHHDFSEVTVIDLSKAPLDRLSERCPEFMGDQLVHGDFFDHFGEYDLILEQTFFCALNPSLRAQYIDKMQSLLAPAGKLVGVLFNIPLNSDRPPFGGAKEEYVRLFEQQFFLNTFDECYNSIPPRQGSELFIHCTSK
ncbi:MAG: SAM-dependent methyltransferase [Cyclobacteriaceae bacterium]